MQSAHRIAQSGRGVAPAPELKAGTEDGPMPAMFAMSSSDAYRMRSVLATRAEFPTGSVASIVSMSFFVRAVARIRSATDTLSAAVAPRLVASLRFLGSTTRAAYATAPPASCSEKEQRTRYVRLERLNFRAVAPESVSVGAVVSKSTTPRHVLRKVIDAGSASEPLSRTLVHVPRPRSAASAPLPSTIFHEPVPPCSAGVGDTSAVNESAEPAHVNSRSTVWSVVSVRSTAVPERQNDADVVKVPSCVRSGRCLPSKTS